MKEQIKKLIDTSGLENKEIVKMLDEIRKEYHRPMNTGTKVLNSKQISEFVAEYKSLEYPVSDDFKYVFYKGGWRKIHRKHAKEYAVYLGSQIELNIRKK